MTANNLLKSAIAKAINVEPQDQANFEEEWTETINSEEDDGTFIRATLDVIDRLMKALPDPIKLRTIADFFDKYDAQMNTPYNEREVQETIREWADKAEEALKV